MHLKLTVWPRYSLRSRIFATDFSDHVNSVVVLLALGPPGLDGARRGDVALLRQEAGDLRGPVTLQAQVENRLDRGAVFGSNTSLLPSPFK